MSNLDSRNRFKGELSSFKGRTVDKPRPPRFRMRSDLKREYRLNFALNKEDVFTISRLLFGISLFCLLLGFYAFCLNHNFDFHDIMTSVMSRNLALFDFETFVSWCHSLLPDSLGLFSVLEDLAILSGSVIYCLGFLFNLLFALIS